MNDSRSGSSPAEAAASAISARMAKWASSRPHSSCRSNSGDFDRSPLPGSSIWVCISRSDISYSQRSAPLVDPGEASDLALGDAMRAQNRDHRAKIAAPACIEHVLACADALHYLPDGRDVHRHGALPVPLVARLSRMVTVRQLHMR